MKNLLEVTCFPVTGFGMVPCAGRIRRRVGGGKEERQERLWQSRLL